MNSKEISNSLLEKLKEIPDPRCKRGIRYKYSDLMLMMIYAILSGFSTGIDIEFFVEENLSYFNELLGIKTAPSHDTFSRVLQLTNFEHLTKVLSVWLVENYPEKYKEYQNKKVLHIDGKAVRAASEKSKGEKPIYLLNSMYEGGSISVYSKKVGDKTNEVGELSDFLDSLAIEDTIVTIDTAGTTNNVIKKIIEKKGHYLLQVKENQGKLKECIDNEIKRLEETKEIDKLETVSLEQTAHGRYEKITTRLIKNTKFICETLDLTSFYGTIAHVAIYDKRTEKLVDGKNVITNTRALLITNLEELSAANIQAIKLSHWNIEAQHWILDVQLNEDRYTARKDNAVQNASALKKFCLWVKKQDDTIDQKKMSVKRFQYKNLMNIERVSELLFMKIASE